MNCKPGDLAIVVIGPYTGVILTCLRGEKQRVRMPDRSIQWALVWETDREFESWAGDTDNLIEDELLRPLRDPGDDAADETLLWLPVPKEQVTA